MAGIANTNPTGYMRAGVKPYNFIQDHCDVEGCTNKHRAKGYCSRHYSAVYHTGAINGGKYEQKYTTQERNRIIKYLLDMNVIREGMLGGEYVAMNTTGDSAISLSTTLGGE